MGESHSGWVQRKAGTYLCYEAPVVSSRLLLPGLAGRVGSGETRAEAGSHWDSLSLLIWGPLCQLASFLSLFAKQGLPFFRGLGCPEQLCPLSWL